MVGKLKITIKFTIIQDINILNRLRWWAVLPIRHIYQGCAFQYMGWFLLLWGTSILTKDPQDVLPAGNTGAVEGAPPEALSARKIRKQSEWFEESQETRKYIRKCKNVDRMKWTLTVLNDSNSNVLQNKITRKRKVHDNEGGGGNKVFWSFYVFWQVWQFSVW